MELDELKFQIAMMLANKKNFSEKPIIPENISKKAKQALYDIEKNHDNSLAVEMFLKNESRLSNTVIIYRGRKIKGYEFWTNVVRYAKSLKALGIKKGDEVPLMMSNCPEYFYMFMALTLIDAQMNIVGTWFKKEYVKKIFEKTNCQRIYWLFRNR